MFAIGFAPPGLVGGGGMNGLNRFGWKPAGLAPPPAAPVPAPPVGETELVVLVVELFVPCAVEGRPGAGKLPAPPPGFVPFIMVDI